MIKTRPAELVDIAVDALMMAALACIAVTTSPTLERDPAWGMLRDARDAAERAHTLMVEFQRMLNLPASPAGNESGGVG